MRLVFLDIDGVLNGHEKLDSGYCGINHVIASRFNRILDAVPDAKIVVSSAWRYLTFQGHMTVKGFEFLLLVHGVKCHERVFGVTEPDGDIKDEPDHFDASAWVKAGLRWRVDQIRAFLAGVECSQFVVIDDLPLVIENFVQTDGKVGLTNDDAANAIAILSQLVTPQPRATRRKGKGP
jgi:hypothetical protein